MDRKPLALCRKAFDTFHAETLRDLESLTALSTGAKLSLEDFMRYVGIDWDKLSESVLICFIGQCLCYRHPRNIYIASRYVAHRS